MKSLYCNENYTKSFLNFYIFNAIIVSFIFTFAVIMNKLNLKFLDDSIISVIFFVIYIWFIGGAGIVSFVFGTYFQIKNKINYLTVFKLTLMLMIFGIFEFGFLAILYTLNVFVYRASFVFILSLTQAMGFMIGGICIRFFGKLFKVY